MATVKGKEGVVRVGTPGSTQVLGELREFTLTITTNEVDTSTMGSEWTGVDGTQKSWSADVQMFFDADDLGQRELEVSEKVYLEFFHAGETSGLISESGTAMISELSRPQRYDNIVEYNGTFTGDGALTTATVV